MIIREGVWQKVGRQGAGAVAKSSHLIHKHEAGREEANWEQHGLMKPQKQKPTPTDISPPTRPPPYPSQIVPSNIGAVGAILPQIIPGG